jgi:hypothetical protein
MRIAAHTFLRASFLSHSSTLLCARFGGGWGIFSKEYNKGLLGFILFCRRVSQDISYVIVHGYSSCDLGLLQLVIVVVVIVYGSSNAKMKLNLVFEPSIVKIQHE